MIIIPILPIRKLRLSEVKELGSLRHTESEWQSQDLN